MSRFVSKNCWHGNVSKVGAIFFESPDIYINIKFCAYFLQRDMLDLRIFHISWSLVFDRSYELYVCTNMCYRSDWLKLVCLEWSGSKSDCKFGFSMLKAPVQIFGWIWGYQWCLTAYCDFYSMTCACESKRQFATWWIQICNQIYCLTTPGIQA